MDEQRVTKPDPEDKKTEYALDRTVLANERTYAAWLRTGIAALAAGLAIEKFMVQVLPEWGTSYQLPGRRRFRAMERCNRSRKTRLPNHLRCRL